MTLNSFIKLIKPKCKMIFYGGSKTYPFIQNSHDNDLIAVIENDNVKDEVRELLHSEGIRRKNISELGIDFHLITLERNETFFTKYRPWVSNYIEFIHNPDNIDLSYNMLEHVNDVKSNLIEFLPKIRDIPTNNKDYYYIYTTLCFLKNNSFELTEEQINNINILHDKKEDDLEIRTKLIEDIIKEIESWQI